MLKRYLFALFLIGIFTLATTYVRADVSKTATANFSHNIPAGKLIRVRMKQLPRLSKIKIVATTNGKITIALIKANSDYQNTSKDPIFTSVLERQSSFSVTNESFGDHLIILDNRDSEQERAVKLTVNVSKSDSIIAANKILGGFEKILHQVYIFSPVNIDAGSCENPNVYSTPDGILLCERYIETIYQELGDKQKTKDVILFAIFHEIGHTLLQQWDHPFYDSEEYADQFAIASLIMLQQTPKLQATIDLFSSRSTTREESLKSMKDDKHPLSGDRAKMISQWIEDPDFIIKWQRILLPHMQTAFLEKVYSKEPAWMDKQLVKQELTLRP